MSGLTPSCSEVGPTCVFLQAAGKVFLYRVEIQRALRGNIDASVQGTRWPIGCRAHRLCCLQPGMFVQYFLALGWCHVLVRKLLSWSDALTHNFWTCAGVVQARGESVDCFTIWLRGLHCFASHLHASHTAAYCR